jgi:hypothetical protein
LLALMRRLIHPESGGAAMVDSILLSPTQTRRTAPFFPCSQSIPTGTCTGAMLRLPPVNETCDH